MSGKSIHDAVKSVAQYTTLNNAYKKKFTPFERWFLGTSLLSDKTKAYIESQVFGTYNINQYNQLNKNFKTYKKNLKPLIKATKTRVFGFLVVRKRNARKRIYGEQRKIKINKRFYTYSI